MDDKYEVVHSAILGVLNDLAFGNGAGINTDDLSHRLLSEWYDKRKTCIEAALEGFVDESDTVRNEEPALSRD